MSNATNSANASHKPPSLLEWLLNKLIRFCLTNKLVILLMVVAILIAGAMVAPFDWDTGPLKRYPVPVDAIPDIGENQQIIFTMWMGRSPQDVQDQISFPLTAELLGVPGVKTVRSYSYFGFSSIYVIFNEDVEFYWSRTRVLEKLNSLQRGTLPEGVQPTLGPDATPLGQIFWYTLEGRDPEGKPVGGWGLNELRTQQDWYVRYSLLSAEGISEVASIGGFVEEYQIDVDPDEMRAARVGLDEVFTAVKKSNIDVGARTIEVNRVEYFIRGLGFVRNVADLENSVVAVNDNVPIYIKDVANVTLGPAMRRGALDKGGAEAVGGVVVVRYGFNPLEAIKNVKAEIEEISPGLPTKVVVDYRQTTRDNVAEFAGEQGFSAFEGVELNQQEWLKWLLSFKVKINDDATTRDEVRQFAASQGFEAFQEDDQQIEDQHKENQHKEHQHNDAKNNDNQLNQDGWRKWLRETPPAKRPTWVVAPWDQWPPWINTSQVTVVPFYDRTGLIYETLGTLNTALFQEILVTIIVILVAVLHLRSSILISLLLPLSVLMCFIAMKIFGVEANVVALSGIAIAIGTMVDMGIILTENILSHLEEADPEEDRLEVVYRASSEVGGAVLTAVATTVISFLPVFTMDGAEGKLFKPLAFTKTFALIASVIVALTIIPPAAHLLFATRVRWRWLKQSLFVGLLAVGLVIGVWLAWWAGAIIAALAAFKLAEEYLPPGVRRHGPWVVSGAAVLMVAILLTNDWLPLGPEKGVSRNFLFVMLLIGGLLAFFQVFQRYLYAPLLCWCLDHKIAFLAAPMVVLLCGALAWLGPSTLFLLGDIPREYDGQALSESEQDKLSWLNLRKYHLAGLRGKSWKGDIQHEWLWTQAHWTLAKSWEGLGKEFMPPLDEGSFLYMPTTMPHASIGEALDVLQIQDKRIMSIPEVEMVVGKIGRVDSPLDPAPVSMIETIINYKPEYLTDDDGHRVNYRYDAAKEAFPRDAGGDLIPDPDGRPFRLWRDKIRSPDDIWKEIVEAAQVPGTTSAPRLQPIAARIVMLQSGMRAPMGVKVKGPDLETIERAALEIERYLKEVPTVEASAVLADRMVGKPYL